MGTNKKVIIMKPESLERIQCSIDADFTGGWTKKDMHNTGNLLSQSRYVILYGGCPMLWKSMQQIEIALSTIESEYISCFSAMQEVISLPFFIFQRAKLPSRLAEKSMFFSLMTIVSREMISSM